MSLCQITERSIYIRVHKSEKIENERRRRRRRWTSKVVMTARDRSRYENGFMIEKVDFCSIMMRICWRNGPEGYNHSVLQSDSSELQSWQVFSKRIEWPVLLIFKLSTFDDERWWKFIFKFCFHTHMRQIYLQNEERIYVHEFYWNRSFRLP